MPNAFAVLPYRHPGDQKVLPARLAAHPRSPVYVDYVVSAAADRGSAAHALLFGEDRTTEIDAENYRTEAARRARDKARAHGRVPVLARELISIKAMIETAAIWFCNLHGVDVGD